MFKYLFLLVSPFYLHIDQVKSQYLNRMITSWIAITTDTTETPSFTLLDPRFAGAAASARLGPWNCPSASVAGCSLNAEAVEQATLGLSSLHKRVFEDGEYPCFVIAVRDLYNYNWYTTIVSIDVYIYIHVCVRVLTVFYKYIMINNKEKWCYRWYRI